MKSINRYRFIPILLILIFSTISSFALTSVIVGASNTELGKFQIKESEPVIIEEQSFRAFELSYEKSRNPILIYIDDHDNCKDYIVRSRYLEIKYVCKETGFGVEPVFGKHMKYDHSVNSYRMDAEAYKEQMYLSDKGLPESQALELIACSFPKLLKYIYKLK